MNEKFDLESRMNVRPEPTRRSWIATISEEEMYLYEKGHFDGELKLVRAMANKFRQGSGIASYVTDGQVDYATAVVRIFIKQAVQTLDQTAHLHSLQAAGN